MEASDAAPFRSRRIRTGLGFTTFSTSFRASVGLPAPGSSFGYMFGDLQKDPNSAHASHRSCLEAAGETMTDIPEQLPANGDEGPGDGNIPAEPETAERVRPNETASQIALPIQPDVIALSVIWWMTMGRGCGRKAGRITITRSAA